MAGRALSWSWRGWLVPVLLAAVAVVEVWFPGVTDARIDGPRWALTLQGRRTPTGGAGSPANRDTRRDDGEFAQPDLWCSAVLPACPRGAVVASPMTAAPVV